MSEALNDRRVGCLQRVGSGLVTAWILGEVTRPIEVAVAALAYPFIKDAAGDLAIEMFHGGFPLQTPIALLAEYALNPVVGVGANMGCVLGATELVFFSLGFARGPELVRGASQFARGVRDRIRPRH